MGNRIIYWSLIGVIILIILGVIYWVVSPLINGGGIEFYLRVGILLLGVIAFGILRLYNAIVGNTRFLVKLREILRPLGNDIITLRAHIGTLGNKVSKSTESTRSLNDSIESLTELISKMEIARKIRKDTK
jgi:hypothetical protein